MQTFNSDIDDGYAVPSTLTWDPDYSSVTATPAYSANMIQGASGSDSTGFFDILSSAGAAVTKVGNTVLSLQAQADNFALGQANRDLARAKQQAALSIGKTQLDIAQINAQRDLALARSNAGGALNSSSLLLMMLLVGGVAMMGGHK